MRKYISEKVFLDLTSEYDNKRSKTLLLNYINNNVGPIIEEKETLILNKDLNALAKEIIYLEAKKFDSQINKSIKQEFLNTFIYFYKKENKECFKEIENDTTASLVFSTKRGFDKRLFKEEYTIDYKKMLNKILKKEKVAIPFTKNIIETDFFLLELLEKIIKIMDSEKGNDFRKEIGIIDRETWFFCDLLIRDKYLLNLFISRIKKLQPDKDLNSFLENIQNKLWLKLKQYDYIHALSEIYTNVENQYVNNVFIENNKIIFQKFFNFFRSINDFLRKMKIEIKNHLERKLSTRLESERLTIKNLDTSETIKVSKNREERNKFLTELKEKRNKK
jgi:hypothetical protein